ncbi:MAG TPA: cache domain-containing protein [Methanospirillum sp.]|nr:cache domain-containing protein [Methanospirillum sp.]
MNQISWLFLTSSLLVALILGQAVSAESGGNSQFSFIGRVTAIDLEGGFFGIQTADGVDLHPVNLAEQYKVDGLIVNGSAVPEPDMVSIGMWGQLVRLESLTPLNGGGVFETSWYSGSDNDLTTPETDAQMSSNLLQSSGALKYGLDLIDSRLASSARALKGVDILDANLTPVLESSADGLPGVFGMTVLDTDGRIIAAYPELYPDAIGKSMSYQSHYSKMVQYPVPLMTEYQKTVEGKDSVILIYPLYTQDNTVTGYISALVNVSALTEEYVLPVLNKTGLVCMILQPNGTVLYDPDPQEIGSSVWNDSLYENSPSVLDTAVRMQRVTAGKDRYQFNQTGTDIPVEKEIMWTTVSLHGADWRVAVIREAPPSE